MDPESNNAQVNCDLNISFNLNDSDIDNHDSDNNVHNLNISFDLDDSDSLKFHDNFSVSYNENLNIFGQQKSSECDHSDAPYAEICVSEDEFLQNSNSEPEKNTNRHEM